MLNGLCAPYRGLGRLDDSLDCLRRSLHIRRETGDRQAEGATLNNIGSKPQLTAQALWAFRAGGWNMN